MEVFHLHFQFQLYHQYEDQVFQHSHNLVQFILLIIKLSNNNHSPIIIYIWGQSPIKQVD